jgi:hypothetical protein
MNIVEHMEFLESLIKEYEERAGRGKSIAAEIRDYAKQQAREKLCRVLIDGDSRRRFYSLTNYTALSDSVRHLLESYFCVCYVNIDFPKAARRGPFIDIDHIRKAGKLRWLEVLRADSRTQPFNIHPSNVRISI